MEKDNPRLSIREQAALLQLNRSNIYYPRQDGISPDDKLVMDEIDRIYTKWPFYGVRRITRQLKKDGITVNHKRVGRLMDVMGIEAIYPKPNLSKNNHPHPVYPYLLKGLVVNHPNQVWGVDITYIKLKNAWLYLVAYLDWFSRLVTGWELSDSLMVDFVLEAAKKAEKDFGLPEIENSDQGVQFTSSDYLDFWLKREVKVSMDSRGRAMDNIFNERLWRTVKYEEVYLKEYSSLKEARDNLKEYFNFYNNERLHQSLDYQTPAEVYFKNLKKKGGEENTKIV